MPDKEPSPFPAMPDIDLSTSGVQKLSDNLKLHEASKLYEVLNCLSWPRLYPPNGFERTQ